MNISVIIPNYKRIFELKRCINSVFKQNFNGKVEVLVVDDFSPNVDEIMKELNNLIVPNNFVFKTIFHSKNKNASAARNTGIQKATGEFVALLDSDDQWPIDYLKHQYEFHESLNEKSFSYSFTKNITDEGCWIKPDFPFESNKYSIGEYIFLKKQSLQTSGLFGRLDSFKKNLFDERLKSFQDYSFCINADYNGFSFVLNRDVTVDRYISLKDNGDHVGRKVDPNYLDFWLTEHFDKMSSSAVSAYKVRNLEFYDLSFLAYLRKLFNECNKKTYSLVIEAILKCFFKKIYRFKFFIKCRILIKNLF
ncbi:glycosyltransferase family 2 protein [Pseudoalteromonas sp. MMG010]|uniref:glycosyltransferase family 2 protein n=1 Tax=Pseudoalteromonas sp. MMG010 TaxID=2822685 RepID=UPI001B39DFC1|nr:glycosyltransferase family 2 protein [Pseudoalteromonas sp. MMG010]MBQ4834229.1 glycosyltransferase family 2 protein [Pseudoalteromonas sp. MMG010]